MTAGKPGHGWRTPAAIGAVVVAVLDTYLVSAYSYQLNSRALKLVEIDFFYWNSRIYRYVALAGLDGILGLLLYLSGTNRAFVDPPAHAQRVEGVFRALTGVKGKISAVGVVKNTVLRDEGLRGRSNAYWSHEVRLTRETMEEEEVVKGINDALQNRLDIKALERDAEQYTKGIFEGSLPPEILNGDRERDKEGHKKVD